GRPRVRAAADRRRGSITGDRDLVRRRAHAQLGPPRGRPSALDHGVVLPAQGRTRCEPVLRQLESEAVTVWRSMLLMHADLVDEIGARLRSEHGLTATEFDVLINIPPHSTIRQRDIVAECVLSGSALFPLLRRLALRG